MGAIFQKFSGFVSSQLGNPRGWFGRYILSRIFFSSHNERAARWCVELLLSPNAKLPVLTSEGDDVDTRILEIGFGGGHCLSIMCQELSNRLNDKNWHIHGWDISEDMIHEATRRNRSWIREGRVSLSVKDIAESIESVEERFRLVFAQNVIYFWENPTEVLRKLKSMSDYVAIVVVDDDGQDRKDWVMHNFPGPVKRAADVEKAMNEVGLRDVRQLHNKSLGCVLVVGRA